MSPARLRLDGLAAQQDACYDTVPKHRPERVRLFAGLIGWGDCRRRLDSPHNPTETTLSPWRGLRAFHAAAAVSHRRLDTFPKSVLYIDDVLARHLGVDPARP